MAIGSVEINAPYGGDIQIAANGDLDLLTDQVGNPAATQLRVIRLLLTNPQVNDENGNLIQPPDDIFNPTWGAGLPGVVGEGITPSLEATIVAAINKGLNGFADVVPGSADITIDTANDAPGGPLNGQLVVGVSCKAVSGETVNIPSLPLPQTFGGL